MNKRYHLIENENTVFVDVDKTLVTEELVKMDKSQLFIIDPYTGSQKYYSKCVRNIEMVKSLFKRDKFIVIWSAAGLKHASAIVDAVGLNNHCHIVMAKPALYIDDLKADDFMLRVHLEDFKVKGGLNE